MNDVIFSTIQIYSKLSNELLILQTSVLQVTAYAYVNNDIYAYKDKIKSTIPDYVSHNQFGCLEHDLLITHVFINDSRLHYRTNSKQQHCYMQLLSCLS